MVSFGVKKEGVLISYKGGWAFIYYKIAGLRAVQGPLCSTSYLELSQQVGHRAPQIVASGREDRAGLVTFATVTRTAQIGHCVTDPELLQLNFTLANETAQGVAGAVRWTLTSTIMERGYRH